MEELLIKIAESRKATSSLKLISHLASIVLAAVFLFQLGLLAYNKEYIPCIKVASAAGVGYVLVTLMRMIINAPRPYELRSFYKENPKNKKGRSFPSRHAYSAFVISALAWLIHPAISVSCAVIALALCVCRVLTGIHFVRDVACGALIGIVAGVLGILIL